MLDPIHRLVDEIELVDHRRIFLKVFLHILEFVEEAAVVRYFPSFKEERAI